MNSALEGGIARTWAKYALAYSTKQLEYLRAEYSWFSFPDGEGARVSFYNSFPEGMQGSISAFWKLRDGTWRGPEDWTSKRYRHFSPSLPDEDILELVVVVANSSYGNARQTLDLSQATISISNWPARFTGPVTTTYSCHNDYGTQNGTYHTEASFSLTHENANEDDKELIYSADPNGQVAWTFSTVFGACRRTGTATCSARGWLDLAHTKNFQPSEVACQGYGWLPDNCSVDGHWECPPDQDPPWWGPTPVVPWFDTGASRGMLPSLSETYASSGGTSCEWTCTMDLTAR